MHRKEKIKLGKRAQLAHLASSRGGDLRVLLISDVFERASRLVFQEGCIDKSS